ncbi:MAG TPA: hypothetical protein VFL04_07900 [Rectinemataceae bacterium]|nr:hypothetical protein [Rectinemataceae bacterium]
MSIPSVAAQVIISIIPIVGIVMGSVVVFFHLLWSHKEKLALIAKGLYEQPRIDIDTFSLLAGLLLSCVGAVLSAIFVAMDGFSYPLLGGAIPLAVGVGFLAFFALRRDRTRT